MTSNKQTINFGNTTIELFDPNLTTDYLNSTTNSNPASVQTSSTSSEDDNFKMIGSGGKQSLLKIQNLSLKRHHTESDIYDLPNESSLSLRIKAPPSSIIDESIIEEMSTARGRTSHIAHQNALELAQLSPKFISSYTSHMLRGPVFPKKLQKSLSWSGNMEDIKEFNDTSPVLRVSEKN
jgi:hypothetical protein